MKVILRQDHDTLGSYGAEIDVKLRSWGSEEAPVAVSLLDGETVVNRDHSAELAERDWVPVLAEWSRETETGDRAEISEGDREEALRVAEELRAKEEEAS